MTWQEISGHGSDIYRLAIEAELLGWGFYQEPGSSSWMPPPSGAEYGYGKAPSDIVHEVHVKHGDLLNDFSRFQQMPEPSSFDAHIAQMQALMEELSIDGFIDPVSKDPIAPNGSRQDIQNVQGELLGWHGEAATAFKTNFLDGLQDKSGAMGTLAWVLLEALRAERKVWELAQKDIDDIAHDTIDVLKGDKSLYPVRDNAGLEAFSALVDVVGIAVPGVGTAATIWSSTKTIAEFLSVPAGEALPRSPETVAEIIARMRDSLDAANRVIREQEEKLRESLAAIHGALATSEAQALYALPQPALATPGDSHTQFGDNY